MPSHRLSSTATMTTAVSANSLRAARPPKSPQAHETPSSNDDENAYGAS